MLGVSIVIAAFNCEKYIDICLQSLFSQTFKNIEIIVCDDCSTDNTYNILKQYSSKGQIILLKNEKNSGSAFTRNKCINVAKYDYIAIQDADDFSYSNRIEKELMFLQENKNFDFVSSGMRFIYSNGESKQSIPKIKFPNKYDFLKHLPFYHATTLFRKESLLLIKGYRVDKKTKRAEDYDLFMRLYAAGYNGANIDDILYCYYCENDVKGKSKYKYRIYESFIRKEGFKKMGIGIKRWPYIIKPLIVGLIPEKIIKHKKGE